MCSFTRTGFCSIARNVTIIFSARVSFSVVIQVCASDIHTLRCRKINMHHELVRELSSKRRRALCVVVGVVKTTTDTDVTAKLTHKFDVNVGGDDSDDEVSLSL